MRRYELCATVKIIIDAENHEDLTNVLCDMDCTFSHDKIVDYEIIDFDKFDEGCEIADSDDLGV